MMGLKPMELDLFKSKAIDNIRTIVAERPNLLLLLAFLFVVLIKSFISMQFQSPWLFQDEMVYAKMAENLHKNDYAGFPILYPFSLSFAYLFSTDKSVIYHAMLLITIIINSSIMFPSYFIMRRYCYMDYAIIGSIAIATLPCLVLYEFSLMCENLLLPLFIFSIWLMLEARRTKNIFLISVAVLSVILLFFTKHSGLAMLFSLVVSVIFELRYCKIKSILMKLDLSNYKILSAMFLLIVSSIAYIFVSNNSTISGYIMQEQYIVEDYLNDLFDIFFNSSHLNEFLILILHELEYLMISSYFIIFLVAAMLLAFVLNVPHGFFLNVIDYGNLAELRRDKALRFSLIYFLFSGIAMLIAVVVFMYQMIRDLPDGYSLLYLCNRDDYMILGRYIDPLVPAIFLFGLIGLYRLSGQKKESRFKIISALAVIYLVTCVLFALTFPYETGKDIMPILYLRHLASLLPTWAIAAAMMPIFFVGLYSSLYNRKCSFLFLFVIIIFSLIISANTLSGEIAASKGFMEQNQIGLYLEKFADESSIILMDLEDDTRDRVMMPFTAFWARGDVVTYSTAEDPSGVYTDYARNVSYIISSKILPYPSLAFSTRGYLLYRPTAIMDNQSLYGFNRTGGWHNLELWNGVPASWMKDNATLTIYSDRDMQAILSFFAQSFYSRRTLQAFCQDRLVAEAVVPISPTFVQIPIDLKRGNNQVRFSVPEGCGRPQDIPELNNIDGRCLSVGFSNLKIWDRNDNSSYREIDAISIPEQLSIDFVSGWHDLENWGGAPTRWMEGDAAIIVYSEENRSANLSFKALSFAGPRSLELYLKDASDVRFNITTELADLSQTIRLTKGENQMKFRVLEGCEKPCDMPALNNSDCRCLSVAVQNLTIMP
jgi:hypothetical protein